MYRFRLSTIFTIVFCMVFVSATPALAATAPATPGAPNAQMGDSSAMVSWQAPSDNGSVIDSYTVTSSPDGLTCSSQTTSCLVQGLTNNVSYTFTVKAHNLIGYSADSPSSTSAFATHVPLKIGTTSLNVSDARFAFTSPTSGTQYVVTSLRGVSSKVIKFDDSGLRVLETTNLSGREIISAFMDRAGIRKAFMYYNPTWCFQLIFIPIPILIY